MALTTATVALVGVDLLLVAATLIIRHPQAHRRDHPTARRRA